MLRMTYSWSGLEEVDKLMNCKPYNWISHQNTKYL
jgi:hypothetical protein